MLTCVCQEIKAPKTTTQRDQSSSTRMRTEVEQGQIDKIANSVVDKLTNGGPTAKHEGEEHFNVDLVHDTKILIKRVSKHSIVRCT
jgi:hypothetical protein